MEADEVLIVRRGGGGECKARDVLQADPDTHVRVGQVHLGEEDSDEGRIRPEDMAQEMGQSAYKSHRLGGWGG